MLTSYNLSLPCLLQNRVGFLKLNIMKKILTIILCALIGQLSFAQFGGGSGTTTNPYIISTIEHIDELYDSVMNYNSFTGLHFSLNNSIEDSIVNPIGAFIASSSLDKSFDGIFHGHNYTLNVKIDTRESDINYFYNSLFPVLGENGKIDSLIVKGSIFASNGIVGRNLGEIAYLTNNLTFSSSEEEFTQYIDDNSGDVKSAGICQLNKGIISHCINNSEIHGTYLGGICNANANGEIKHCINQNKIVFYNESYYIYHGGGICGESYWSANITHCTNLGNLVFTGNLDCNDIGGIVGYCTSGNISFCQNYGNIGGKIYWVGGVVGTISGGTITNCSNYGDIAAELLIGGIVAAVDVGAKIFNCFNSGNLSGNSYIGGLAGVCSTNSFNDTITHCLNIGEVQESAIIDSVMNENLIISNYYDKQMCLSKGIEGVDIPGTAEGKLTTQLTGTSTELQAMLGDGWSYAEGRYPIPLGLENDSMALVAATPIYLYAENESNYNHVDSVTKNFTVGLQNNVAWTENNGRVSIDNENVTLLNVGVEKLIVSLGEYEKEVRINIEDTEVATPQAIISNNISVYPNPACKNITVNIKGNSGIKLQIVNASGKIVAQIIDAGKVNTINISHLKEGMYFLQIFENGNVIYDQKIIKQDK